ncbi:MAG TPA: helix-turn-helix domain-containing protein [Puia sp.]|nr:helix-turn-helix domain-containing protein [Puia sp.]
MIVIIDGKRYRLVPVIDDKFPEEKVIDYCTNFFNISFDDMKQRNRKREIVFARQVTMFMLYKFTNLSLSQIGKIFMGMDHTSIIHSKHAILDLMDSDPSIKNQITNLQNNISLLFN